MWRSSHSLPSFCSRLRRPSITPANASPSTSRARHLHLFLPPQQGPNPPKQDGAVHRTLRAGIGFRLRINALPSRA